MELKLIEVLSAEPLEKFKSWVINGDPSIKAVITPSTQASREVTCGTTAQSIYPSALVLSLILASSLQAPSLSFTCPLRPQVSCLSRHGLNQPQTPHFIHLKTNFC